MKKLFILLLCLCVRSAIGQVSIVTNFPPNGLSLKQQLWNLIITNGGNTSMTVYVELHVSDAQTSNPVFNARSASFVLNTGSQLKHVNSLSPIQYNVVDPNYASMMQSDFLPVGNFRVCHSVWLQESDRVEKIVEECDFLTIEPLSPPQLVLPENESSLETIHPLFTWIPPGPIQLFTNATYEVQVAAILPGQTENEAIQQNIPLFVQSGITGTTLPYPVGAGALQPDVKYAWRVSVLNNQQVVARTDTWWFRLPVATNDSVHKSLFPFLKLRTGSDMALGVAINELRFEYLNETTDTLWDAQLTDLTRNRALVQSFNMDSIPLRHGQNLVSLNLAQVDFLEHKHIYVLEVRNSRNQRYHLRFEYHRKEN